MISSILNQIASPVLCVCFVLTAYPSQPSWAQAELEHSKLPMSAAPVESAGVTHFKPTVESVQWEGRKLSPAEGRPVLMAVITDTKRASDQRARALELLGRLRDRTVTPELLALYPTLRTMDEKVGVILCLSWSEDPRGLPLYTQILEREQDDIVRLFAAAALAKWNVRQGVAELVDLLESDQTLPPSAHRPSVRENALVMFMHENHRKGWGFSEDRLREETALNAEELDDNQRWALTVAGAKKWFSANEHRFPEWNPGDPLPETPEAESDTPDE